MITEIRPRPSDTAAPTSRHHQLRAFVVWLGVGLFALGAAIVLADLVFPEPTMLRLPLMLATLAAVGLVVVRRRRDRDAVTSAPKLRHSVKPFPER